MGIMKKIINYLKGLVKKFNSSRKKSERLILNNDYRENAELIRFVQEQIRILEENSMPFVITWYNFPADQYGKVELVWNNKVVQTANLMRGEHNLIYWKFDE